MVNMFTHNTCTTGVMQVISGTEIDGKTFTHHIYTARAMHVISGTETGGKYV